MKHTKGKWEIIPERNGLAIYELRAGDKPRMVSLEEHEANAKLIAAAPELLEALIQAQRYFNKAWTGKSKLAQRNKNTINEAIKKTTS